MLPARRTDGGLVRAMSCVRDGDLTLYRRSVLCRGVYLPSYPLPPLSGFFRIPAQKQRSAKNNAKTTRSERHIKWRSAIFSFPGFLFRFWMRGVVCFPFVRIGESSLLGSKLSGCGDTCRRSGSHFFLL